MSSLPAPPVWSLVTRELVLHALYEAAELEHNLMCTYLYAAFSLKSGIEEGLSPREAEATARWRREILAVAVDEASHLTAVWNITSALGGAPRFGRTHFPLVARQPRDHERHGARDCASDDGQAVPLRRQRAQALLQRHPRAHRLPLVG